MAQVQRPHVSAALVQLRTTLTWSALGVIASAIVQMLVFSFVHFTDARWTTLRTPPAAQQLTVVQGEGEPTQVNGRQARVRPSDEPARVLSRWDGTLRTFGDTSASVGVVAAFTLWIGSLVGVVVAGGGAVPGVEKAVRASTWATVLFLAALPVVVALPGLRVGGAFEGYDAMVRSSGGFGDLSPLGLMASNLALPLVAAVLAGHTLLLFREGVEAGVIVTSVSELDRKLDKEIETIRAAGIASNHGQRAVGALNRPLGDSGEEQPDRAKSRSWVTDRDRSIGESSPGNPLRRPV